MELETNVHHLYWPRRSYRGMPAAAFRGLPCHKVRIPISLHRELHATIEPPARPTTEEMLAELHLHKQRQCPVCHHPQAA